MRIGYVTAAAAVLALAGCDDKPTVGAPVAGGRVAVATLRTPAGKEVGRATVREVAGGLRVTIDARFLPPGMHGAHLHTVGRCDGPDFASAGPHWNPTGMKHGTMNPQGPHSGDLPNLSIGADGRGTVGINLPGASFDALLDADGAAMVLHADVDDMMTDPSGNSGGRIACGVLVAG
ncbi:superoxide dismutase family protein [Sphingomonas panacisoli]|uniref:Superoxide dismutase family protein n=1 Tax=Sphingomonas panacisoli TaxID=1813879 RepID=A0A5B8LLE6_9SPHN|nr:superoxide dismutase family protein [Sphingomonas panacisoli]QDZ09058.1 superoxide dismutase family protein [Sphingomonas panacisoli]